MALSPQFLRGLIYRKTMFLFCDYITIWGNFSWQGGHSAGWVLQQWNGSLVPWQPRTDWLIKIILYYRFFFISPFAFALRKDQKHKARLESPSGDRKGKIRQSGSLSQMWKSSGGLDSRGQLEGVSGAQNLESRLGGKGEQRGEGISLLW